MHLSAPTISGPIAGATLADNAAPLEAFSPFLKRETYLPKPAGRAGFILLTLATSALLVRPADLFPALENWPVYQTLIALCLITSWRRIVEQLHGDTRARALTLLLFTFGATVVTSNLFHGNLYGIRTGGFEFAKIIVYYLIVLACVDSVARLRLFALALCASTLLLATLSVLAYDKLLDVPSLTAIRQSDRFSEDGVIERLVGTGIFNDPNDLCLILIVAIACCGCFVATTPGKLLRLGWCLPIGFFGYAISLTYSRGGLGALLVGAGVAIGARWGAMRTVLLASVLVPVILIVSGSRQTHVDLSDPTDTFQTRLDRWSDSLTLFKQSPLIGVGQDQQVEQCGQVAHNTYIQNFAELGIVGGAGFLGLLLLSLRGVLKIDLPWCDPTLVAVRPYLAGGIAGYAAGLVSLSRGYTISTYLVFALAAAFINLAPRRQRLVLDGAFRRQLFGLSLLTVALVYLAIRVLSGVGGGQ